MNTDHQALVKRVYTEIWSGGNVALVDQLMTPSYINHDPSTPGTDITGREAFKGLVKSYREAFPDLRFDVTAQHGMGDIIVTEWKASGTHKGALMGIPATGRNGGGVEGITISRIQDGQMAEDRIVWDTLGLMRQLGVVPS